jgi:hypothetical protein
MTVMKTSEENNLLKKDIEKLEHQGLEARRTIRALYKQMKTPPPAQPTAGNLRKNKTTQTTEDVRNYFLSCNFFILVCF